jgi:hypothetical protein
VTAGSEAFQVKRDVAERRIAHGIDDLDPMSHDVIESIRSDIVGVLPFRMVPPR